MADRGLARSGIARKVDIEREQDYQRATNKVDLSKRVGLSAIARKRLQSKAAYDQARAQLALGIATPPSITPPEETNIL